MQQKIKLRFIDYIVALLFLSAAVFSLVYAMRHTEGTTRLIITSGNNEWIYPLDTDRVIEVQGELGISRIAIQDGQARFLDSPCDNRLCIHSSPLQRDGDWSACLPNQIFMYVKGTGNSDTVFDAVGF